MFIRTELFSEYRRNSASGSRVSQKIRMSEMPSTLQRSMRSTVCVRIMTLREILHLACMRGKKSNRFGIKTHSLSYYGILDKLSQSLESISMQFNINYFSPASRKHNAFLSPFSPASRKHNQCLSPFVCCFCNYTRIQQIRNLWAGIPSQ